MAGVVTRVATVFGEVPKYGNSTEDFFGHGYVENGKGKTPASGAARPQRRSRRSRRQQTAVIVGDTALKRKLFFRAGVSPAPIAIFFCPPPVGIESNPGIEVAAKKRG
jgi:hypothetical protein